MGIDLNVYIINPYDVCFFGKLGLSTKFVSTCAIPYYKQLEKFSKYKKKHVTKLHSITIAIKNDTTMLAKQ